MSEKSEKFLINRGWDKNNPVTGGVFFKGVAELLDEYEQANEASTSHDKALDINLVSGFSSEQMEKAFNDGIEAVQNRNNEAFDIKNYR